MRAKTFKISFFLLSDGLNCIACHLYHISKKKHTPFNRSKFYHAYVRSLETQLHPHPHPINVTSKADQNIHTIARVY